MRPLFYSGELSYAVVFWAIFVFWLIFELTASKLKRAQAGSSARDRGSLVLIVTLFWLGLGLSFAASFLLPQASIAGNRPLIFYLGIATMLAGLAFRRHAMSVLGRFFAVNVAVHSDHALVQAGPYRYIRHPSYTGALITQYGFGLALGNWVSILAILGCMSIAYA